MNHTNASNMTSKKSLLTWLLLGVCVITVFLSVSFYVIWIKNRLPSDEEMIAHLNVHREEFEEVIRRNRVFIQKEYDPSVRFPPYEEGMKELMDQAGIVSVNPMLLGTWLPDPYSLSTAQRWREVWKSCEDDWKQYHAMDGMKRKLTPPQCRLLKYQYGGLRVNIEPYNKFFAFSLVYCSVQKDYIHFPEPPKIENGYLLGPFDTDGQPIFKKRVFSSLNNNPWPWREYESVYRRIDAHWFLRLTNGH